MKTCTYETRIGASIGAKGGAAACKAPAQRRGGLAQLLAFCLASMLLVALFGAALPSKALAVETVMVDSWSALYDALQVDGNLIHLTADVKYGEGGGSNASTPLTVPAGVTATLDLNGHIVDRALTTATSGGSVIDVAGNLTITDSDPTATHDGSITYTLPTSDEVVAVNGGIITGGNAASVTVGSGSSRIDGVGGGGMLLRDNAALTMSGGTICANQTRGNGGGLYALTGAIINMDESAVIAGNSATVNGGGVYLHKGCDLSMSGNAMIRGNLLPSSYLYGGGVYLYEGNTVDMSGNASICDNKAYAGGGAWVAAWHNTFTITGNATIAGNIATSTSDSSGGGGIIVEGSSNEGTDSKLVMTGGSISGNKSAGYGGGVEVNCEGIFEMSGGSITENEAKYGGGVYVRFGYNYNDPGVLRLSGSPVISGNTGTFADYNGPQYLHNVYAQTRIYVTGSLAGANIGTIGVSMTTNPYSGRPNVVFTSGYGTYNEGVNPATIFKADGPYKVTLSEATDTAGEAQLSLAATYDLWIAGTQVTEINCDDVFGDGKVSYDPAENVLTLDGYDSGTDPGFHVYGVLYSEIPDLTISVANDSVIRASKSDASSNAQTALVVKASTKLEIAEGATLDLYGPDSNNAYYCRVIEIPDSSSTLAITGAGTLNVVGTPYCGWAVRGEGNLTIDGPDVTVSVVPNVNGSTYTICLYDTSATVNSGTLTLVATGQNQYVIYSDGYASSSVTAAEGLAIYLGSGPDDLEKQGGQQCSGSKQGYLKVCEPFTYDLWVAGVQVTIANAADLTAIDGVDVAAGGKLSFDPASNTLAMNDVSIVNGRTEGSGIRNYAGIYSEIPLNITVEGTCSATARDCETSAWCAGVFANYTGNSGEEADSLSISLAPGAVLTAKGGTGGVMCKSIGVHSNRKLAISGTGTLNALGNAVEGYGSESRGISAGDSIDISGSPTIVATGDSATSGYRSVGVLIEDGSNNEASLTIGGGMLTAKGVGGCIYSYGIANEFSYGSVVVSDGKVVASAGAGSSESFGVKAYSSSIAGGSLEAKSAEDGYQHHALSTVPTISEGIPAGASVNADGSGAVAFVAGDNATYNWFKAPFAHTVSFAAGGGSGTMTPVEVEHGAQYALPKGTFTAPKCKAFDKWDKGAVGANITVNADVTLTAQWKDAHSLKKVDAVAATCEKGGTEAYWKCSACGTMFSDAAGTKQITKPVATKALGHSWSAVTYKWSDDLKTCTATRTCSRNKSHVETEKATATSKVTKEPTATTTGTRTYTATFKNSAFKTQTKTEVIPATGEADIAKAVVVDIPTQGHTGNPLKPALTVTFGGKTLKAGVDYDVVYENNVSPGTATATITGKGAFKGTKTVTFQIAKAAPTKWDRKFGQEALDTMQAIVDAGWSGETGGTVVLATDAGYWDALTAAGIAGFYGAPVLMTAPDVLSPQTAKLLKQLKPKRIFICGGPNVVHESTAKAAKDAAGGAAVDRYWGQTMTDTADDVYAKAAKAAGGTWSTTAFVATSNGYWDALAAAPVSYTQRMPIFLTASREALSSNTIKAMKVGGVQKVIIVGGTAVVADSVDAQLKAAGIEVAGRLWGMTAIDTSVKVAEYGLKCGMSADNMGVATQNGYWDALAGAALCGKLNGVLVLVDQADSASIKGFAGKYSGSIARGFVFGGGFAVSDEVYDALERATSGMRASAEDEPSEKAPEVTFLTL